MLARLPNYVPDAISEPSVSKAGHWTTSPFIYERKENENISSASSAKNFLKMKKFQKTGQAKKNLWNSIPNPKKSVRKF